MIDIVLDGEEDPVRNYYNWMTKGGNLMKIMKTIWTGIWLTGLLTFHLVETFMVLVLGHAARETWIGMKQPPEQKKNGFF